MNLLKYGNGDNIIICLHGWGQDKNSLTPLFSNIDKEANTVYFLDLPGFGDNAGMKHSMSVHEYAKYVIEFMLKHQIKQATFVGHSFGARVTTEINKYDSSLINKIVYIGGAGVKDELSLRAKIRQSAYKISKSIITSGLYKKNEEKYLAELKYLFGSADYLKADPVLQETLVKAVNYDQSEDLKLIAVPTLLIWGKLDDQTPMRHAKIMNDNIANSELIVYEDGTHFVFLEHTHEIAQKITNFLGGSK